MLESGSGSSPCACDQAVLDSSTACWSLLRDSPTGLLWQHGMPVLQRFPMAIPFPSIGQPSALHIVLGPTALQWNPSKIGRISILLIVVSLHITCALLIAQITF